MMRQAVNVKTLLKMKQQGQKIAMMTAYDYPTAKLLSESGMHVLLVGDSLGMVVQGRESTVSVTLDQMIYHSRLVVRGVERALIVADLPFMTYQISPEQALQSAGRLMKESGVQAVKLEGGRQLAPTVARLVDSGIPVMGHIGLTPQSVHALGGFAVQGKTSESAKRILDDALALEDAGAFSVVLEMVPKELAQLISKKLRIPTIGIGAGPHCDGQVLVFHDFIGFTSGYIPRHNKRYENLGQTIKDAALQYITEVSTGAFPAEEQTVSVGAEEWEQLIQNFGGEIHGAH